MYEEEVKKYRMIYDHHTHTIYSHGTGTIEDNVRVAHEKGIESIAITEHGPSNFRFGMRMSDIPKMRADIEAARAKYPDVEVLLGVEANTKLRRPFMDISLEDAKQLDLVIAGYHYSTIGAGMIPNYIYRKRNGNDGLKYELDENGEYQAPISMLMVKNTGMIINLLKYNEEIGNHIEILSHPGDKGPFDIYDIAKTCQETGTLLEINGKHKHMTVDELKVAAGFDVKFVISSDAHKPENVGMFEPQLIRALEAGIDPERIVNIAKK